MENKVISTEYVKKNFIRKDKILEIFKKKEFDYEPWSTYQISGEILFNLQVELEKDCEI